MFDLLLNRGRVLLYNNLGKLPEYWHDNQNSYCVREHFTYRQCFCLFVNTMRLIAFEIGCCFLVLRLHTGRVEIGAGQGCGDA